MTTVKRRCFRHSTRNSRSDDDEDEDGHGHGRPTILPIILVPLLVLSLCVSASSAVTYAGKVATKVVHHVNKGPRGGCHYKMAGKVVQLRFGHGGARIEDFEDVTGDRKVAINNYTVQLERQALVRRLTEDFGLDVWTADMETVTFLVAPWAWEELEDTLIRQNIEYQVLKDDIRQAVNSTSPRAGWRPRRRKRQAVGLRNDTAYDETLPKFDFDDFHDSTTINNQLKLWADAYPDIFRLDLRAVTLFEKGRIYRVRLGEFRYRKKRKPAIFIEAANHAREWISPAVAMYFLNHIIETHFGQEGASAQNQESLLEHFDFHFIPMGNPDGYDFSLEHPDNRLWRKNMNPNKVPENIDECAGVDLNRNYDSHWGQLGSSPEFCSEAYRGARAASELETQVVQELLLNTRGMREKFRMSVSIHCCAGMVLTPYGFKMELPKNYNDLELYGKAFADGARRTSRRFDFKVGPSSLTLYPASGMLSDFAKHKADIPLSYAVELPNTGPDLFLTPPSDIRLIGDSFVGGMREMLLELARNLPKDVDGKERVRYA